MRRRTGSLAWNVPERRYRPHEPGWDGPFGRFPLAVVGAGTYRSSSVKWLDLNRQYLEREEEFQQALLRVVTRGQYLDGPEVPALEADLSRFLGEDIRSIACSSGSDALVLAMRAIGVGEGDEVVVPAFTFAATAEAVVHVGAVPVFCDVDAAGLMAPETVSVCLTDRTRAVLAVSLFGQVPRLEELEALLQGRDIALLEDAAQSFGAKRHGVLSGSTVMSTTSFFPGKPLGAWGKGGAVFCRDPDLADRLRALRNHGQAERGSHDEVGWNMRMDELQAAVLQVKLAMYPRELARRQELADLYARHLPTGLERLALLPGNESSWSQLTVLSPERDALRGRLSAEGVPTSVHYTRILPEQPAFSRWARDGAFPRAKALSRQILSLPLHPYLTDDEVVEVCAVLASCV